MWHWSFSFCIFFLSFLFWYSFFPLFWKRLLCGNKQLYYYYLCTSLLFGVISFFFFFFLSCLLSFINPTSFIIDFLIYILYRQSTVSGHSELSWIFNCHTLISSLQRMTQFKDKSKSSKETVNSGLLCYPILMAADILLYRATHVPVGDDQTQHLELTKDIASNFNRFYEQDFFPLPQPLFNTQTKRVLSLKDATVKVICEFI